MEELLYGTPTFDAFMATNVANKLQGCNLEQAKNLLDRVIPTQTAGMPCALWHDNSSAARNCCVGSQ